MKILFQNARILSLKDNEPLFEGELLTADERIAYVGKKAPEGPYDRVIDCGGDLLLPGFKNAHTHSPMVFLRSLTDDKALHAWLYEDIFPHEAKLQPGDEYALSKVAILEYLTSGITASFDMYFTPAEQAAAAREMGFRNVILGTLTKDFDSAAKMKEDFDHFNHLDPLISYQMGFHAEYTVKEEALIGLSKVAHELHCPIYTHIAETKEEVQGCRERHHGLTPARYFEELGLFDYGGGGYHCVYFTPADIRIFQKHDLSVISNPGSNAKLASGIAPLCTYREKGLNIALGSDGPASNNGLDMFYEMKLACVLQKLKTGRPEAFPAPLALEAATRGGAKAMGLKECSILAPGQYADLVEIDLFRPNMQPLNNIPHNLVYAGAKDDVKRTMVAGKILYEEGHFNVGEDVQDIYRKAQAITDRLTL